MWRVRPLFQVFHQALLHPRVQGCHQAFIQCRAILPVPTLLRAFPHGCHPTTPPPSRTLKALFGFQRIDIPAPALLVNAKLYLQSRWQPLSRLAITAGGQPHLAASPQGVSAPAKGSRSAPHAAVYHPLSLILILISLIRKGLMPHKGQQTRTLPTPL